MLFHFFGQLATRFRIPIMIVWVGAAVVMTLVAPNIEDVASSDQADFLPANAPHAHAAAVVEDTFPASEAPGSTVIVIDARAAGGVLDRDAATFDDEIGTPVGQFVAALTGWLASDDAPAEIESVVSPAQSPSLAEILVSDDNALALLRVNLTVSSSEERTPEVLDEIDDWLAENRPADVATYQTGAAPIASNTTNSIRTTVDRTIWVTVVLVILMLLVVYRSPVSPLIPLAAVTVAYLITRGIVAFLGDSVMTITSYANVLVVVVMYGAGTDYCLFLISRFREEMADDHAIERATQRTVHRVGETISSSAGTIFVGFMAMAFAEMGVFNTSGPALAIGIVLSLLAGLTFVPALLATLGDRAFWPGQARHRDTGRLYEATSQFVSTYPLIAIVVICGLMLPLSIYGVNQRVTYDLLADLPDDKPAVVGYSLMEDSLGPGVVMPLVVVVTERDTDAVAGEIVALSDAIFALDGVADVRSLNTPLGRQDDTTGGLLRVDTQLGLLRQALAGFQSPETAANVDPAQVGPILESINAYLATLGQQFPEVADDPHLATLNELLANPLQLIARQDDLAAALDGLAARFNSVEDPYLLPTAFADVVGNLPPEFQTEAAQFDTLFAEYLADNATSYKLEVELAYRSSTDEGMAAVTGIRDILDAYDEPGEAVASGGAAINTDIRDTMDRDLLRAIGFVLVGIFVVLMIMLRSLVAPVYLIGTVLLSFTFTLGLTTLVFKALADVEGLTFYVPFFQFVFLVGLGIDYSIFLFGRIKEEVGNHGIREGVHVAVASTGAIITSAGIILAGTFAAMMAGEVRGLQELGFAVAVGVLIDTFVVRTMLDPALATFFGRWTWWPGGVPRALQDRTARPDTTPEPAREAGT